MLPQRTQIQIATPKPLTLSGTKAIGGRPTLQLHIFPYFLNRCSLALVIDRQRRHVWACRLSIKVLSREEQEWLVECRCDRKDYATVILTKRLHR
jgi:hypothetical protein